MNNERIGQSNEEKRLEGAIFAALRRSKAEIPLVELLNRISEQGIDDDGAVRAAITRLLAESKLEMTPNRRIHLPLNGCPR